MKPDAAIGDAINVRARAGARWAEAVRLGRREGEISCYRALYDAALESERDAYAAAGRPAQAPATLDPWDDDVSEFAPDADTPIAVACPVATAPTIPAAPLAAEDLPDLEPHTVGDMRAGLLIHPSGSRVLLEFAQRGADPICVPLDVAQARVVGAGLLKLADEADVLNLLGREGRVMIETITSQLATALRSLSDEDLVLAAGPWIQDRIRQSIMAAGLSPQMRRAFDEPRRASKPAAAPAKKERERGASWARGSKKAMLEGAEKRREAVFRALAASETGLLLREVVAATEISVPHVKHALVSLRKQGRASYTGQSKLTRWSVAA